MTSVQRTAWASLPAKGGSRAKGQYMARSPT